MSAKIKNRHRLKRKEVIEIISEIRKTFKDNFFNEKSSVETGEIEGIKILYVEGEPCFMIHGNKYVFTIHGLHKYSPKEKYVIVDMGAVKFVTSGADVMSPGIVDADKNIKEGDHVWVCDKRHHKPIAVGIATINGDKMISESKGKSVEIYHYVGDKLWKLINKNI